MNFVCYNVYEYYSYFETIILIVRTPWHTYRFDLSGFRILIEWLVFNVNFSSTSAISLRTGFGFVWNKNIRVELGFGVRAQVSTGG